MQTTRYIVKRIILAAVSLFAIITITFFLMNLMPGDPFMSEKASEESRAILIEKYGLDQPVYVQYEKYLQNLFHGDMGTSYVLQKGRAVRDIITESFAVSMKLGVKALVVAIILGIFLGCVSGLCKDRLPDGIIRVVSSLGISMPGYVVASGLMIILAVNFKILPVNYNKPGGAIMPVITLALYPTSYLTRLTRASILEVMNQDYLRTERAKGMSEFVVVFVHALKNSLIPVITYLGPLTASILTGGFVAESVFNVPGLGRYFVSSISSRDYTMIMGVTIFYSALIILMNLVCDILYKIVDPRITLD
ncbi:MAG: ABC transporter permease [Lachnospiraceae bacterium]|nr:ABC transporter permease [Lachnospiraceae bacterium]MDD7078711.1 ABC transporter permease [Lachnospiraceae bacterium]MDY3731262.1 ABC transporter permease [Candidatus Choladocola sp.]